jgi:nitronate monooxygenase
MNWPSSRLCDLLATEIPLIQSPMSGSCTPELAAAVANAGGLGSLGLSGYGLSDVVERCRAARRATNGALNFNFLLYDIPDVSEEAWARATAALAPHYRSRGVEAPARPSRAGSAATDALIEAALAEGPSVMSFHYALPGPGLMARIKSRGVRVICTATTPDEARRLEAAGADAVIAQGAEAGGHRGTHADPCRARHTVNEIGLVALVPAIRDAVDIPVIAAGGIADGRGVAAAFMLGADGVQMGTAFLRCPEASVPDAHRRALASATANDTETTRALSGRPARALRNRLIDTFRDRPEDSAPYPLQFDAVAPLRDASLARDDGDFLSLWAGQGVGLAEAAPADTLLHRIARDALVRMGRV